MLHRKLLQLSPELLCIMAHGYQCSRGTYCSHFLSHDTVFWYMGTNVPEWHIASILMAEVSKSEKVAGDTKGRRKEMGNERITTINQREEEGPKQAHGNSGFCKWQVIQEIRT